MPSPGAVAYEVLGYSGGIILASYTWPQIYRIYQTKSSHDISFPSLLLYMLGILMLLAYNIHIAKPALYIPGFVELTNIVVLIALKLVYDIPPAPRSPRDTGVVSYDAV